MTSLERVTKAIKCDSVDRVPWVPFVGCHAGALQGVTATEYLQSSDLIVEGAKLAVERYKADGVPVTFDLQMEAEVMGCRLEWADDNPPAVVSHPLGNGTKLEDLRVPRADEGRIGLTLEAARRIRKNQPDVAVYGLITGPFTLALHLLGTDIFMKMFDNREYVNKLMEFCRDVATAMAGYYIEAGCDVIALVDPMTSQIGPDQFREFVRPFMTPVFESIREKGALSSFFVCGHAEQNIPEMCACKCDNVSVDENIPLDFVRETCLANNVSFGGNLQLTSVLLLGKPVDAQKNAIACLEVAGEKGFLLAPGCDLPYATPPENLEAIPLMITDPYQRDIVKAMVVESDGGDKLDLQEYGQFRKVVVDIITLDSEACAPCQYMVDAVRKVAPQFEGIVEWREHKIKYKESLVFMTSLMVHNVPTICIDGQIKFVSRIPPRDELIAAIQERINEKFRMKIQRRRGEFYLLGADNEATARYRERLEKAIAELGSDTRVTTISDEQSIASFGVAMVQTPAVVMATYRLKSTCTTPDIAVIKEWIKDM
ncbi:MAG: hypothetical protein JW936_00755 [Sedimentisphaerales bacterium]|nr:hypothetical protein [Sedimentisphaerales bacterium]